MITGLRGAVLLDSADAAYLAEALQRLCAQLPQGLSPSGKLGAIHAQLAKAVAYASNQGRDTSVDVREVGEQRDSRHAAAYDLVDSGEASRILGCTPANVRDLARRGRLPRHRAGGRWLYPARSVVVLAEERAARRG